MDLVTIVIVMCIGNVAGWLATLYLPGGGAYLLTNVGAAIAGGLVVSWPVAYVLPQWGIVASGPAAMAGAVLVLAGLHRRRGAREGQV